MRPRFPHPCPGGLILSFLGLALGPLWGMALATLSTGKSNDDYS